MAHPRGQAAERAVSNCVRVSAEYECAREGVAFFRKDHVADALAGMKLGNALFLDPLARSLLRNRILLPDWWIVVIEDDHNLLWTKDFVAAHFSKEVGRARRATIVEHDIIGRHIDDLADLDALAVGVLGDDLGKGVHC